MEFYKIDNKLLAQCQYTMIIIDKDDDLHNKRKTMRIPIGK